MFKGRKRTEKKKGGRIRINKRDKNNVSYTCFDVKLKKKRKEKDDK